MVSTQSVERQLKRLKFNMHSWGRTEIRELPHILFPDEEIYELVNGMYEGGFALLVATDMRVLLVDKKPLNYLTVEDLRFDMINELDYSHRMIGAQISISAGSKNLKFKSYNQQRLRKLIGHVQHSMAETKREMSLGQQHQKQHLEQINQQLQAYLIAQHQQQQALRDQLAAAGNDKIKADIPELPKPSPELSDFLFAQSLLKQYREQEASQQKTAAAPEAETMETIKSSSSTMSNSPASPQLAELYAEGMQEIFGRQKTDQQTTTSQAPATTASTADAPQPAATHHNPLEINPLSIAYSKLPMALRNRKFGRPSFHAHSQVTSPAPSGPQPFAAP